MIFLPFKASTRRMAPPAGWDQELDGPCGTLCILDAVDVQSGQNFQYSLWRPSPEELELLREGGAIQLGIMGTSHPVINMGVLSPELLQTWGPEEVAPVD